MVPLINTESIDFDIENPRGETEQEIIEDESFEKLKHSINNFGILEPLVVKLKGNEKSEYILIDGERRLRAAKELKIEKIPAVTAKNETDGLKLAYQIHMHRKPWTKIAEIKAIERIILSIKYSNSTISEVNLKKEIKEITNHSNSTINEFLIILKYDDSVISKVKLNELNYSYLIRIEDDFIVPLKKYFDDVINLLGEDEIRLSMIKKAELGLLINTRFMMSSEFKLIYQTLILREEVKPLLINFIQTDIISASDLLCSFNNLKNQNETISGIGKSDSEQLDASTLTEIDKNKKLENTNIKPENVPCENANNDEVLRCPIKGKKQNQTSILDIKIKIESVGKIFSSEEKEYLEEALDCLATKTCLKAAVLMIWASGISKILRYINNDLAGFKSSCLTMKSAPKSFYKHFTSNFQTSFQSIEEIREAAKDMQLICYLGFEEIITPSDFKKLKAHYDTRNDCAHPTSLKLSMSEVIVIFENMYKLILDNPKLK